MVYIQHIPSPPLSDYINRFYCLSGPMPHSRTKILPLPVIDVKFNLGGALQMSAVNGSGSRTFTESWGVGIWNIYHVVNWPPDLRLFGIGFKPDGAYPFLRMPLSELHNQVVPMDAIWKNFAEEIRERLHDAPTIQAGFALLEHVLRTRLTEDPPGMGIVHHAAGEIARHHGTLSIRALSEQIGVSQNHLCSLVKRIVGVSPKELARFFRFEHALCSIDPTLAVDWALFAQQMGYYDQSHLNKDFAAFIGHAPSTYLRIRFRESIHLPERERLLRVLPTE